MFKITIILSIFLGLAHALPANRSSPFRTNWRIIGGKEAEDGQFPFIAVLEDGWGRLSCGASIINENYILTAAHCVHKTATESFTILVGSNLFKGGDGQRHQPEKIILDEDLDDEVWVPDLALVKVFPPFVFSDKVQPIPLETEDVGADVEAIIAGWGKSNEEFAPNKLQYVKVKTVTLPECRKFYDEPIYDFNVCTSTEGNQGTCFGDSGGPLVANGKLIGIVNFGEPCAIGSPDVFLRVSSFVDWINEQISLN